MFCTVLGGFSEPPFLFCRLFPAGIQSLSPVLNYFMLHIDESSVYFDPKYPSDNRGGGAMKDLIIEIVQALVDQPKQVSVTEIAAEHTSVLELRMAKTDMGKVIGKRGRTAQAIRTILSAASGKAGKRYILEIVE